MTNWLKPRNNLYLINACQYLTIYIELVLGYEKLHFKLQSVRIML